MIKAKTFNVVGPIKPKGILLLNGERYFDMSPVTDFAKSIGEERIRQITVFNGAIDFCTIFYESDGLHICPSCGLEHSPECDFCRFCGNPLVPITEPEYPACPRCGKLITQKSSFCPFCGEHLPKPSKKKGIFD